MQSVYTRSLPLLLTMVAWVLVGTGKVALSESGPKVVVRRIEYPIQGSTAAQLRSQLNQLGPVDPVTGKHFDAHTRWFVRWRYRYQPGGNQCRIVTASVTAEITFTMPSWKAPANVSTTLKQRWSRYLRSLQTHENGHQAHGVQAATEVQRVLLGLTAPTCDQMDAIVNQSARAVTAQYNRQDVEYDRRTQHGRTQGAVFP